MGKTYKVAIVAFYRTEFKTNSKSADSSDAEDAQPRAGSEARSGLSAKAGQIRRVPKQLVCAKDRGGDDRKRHFFLA